MKKSASFLIVLLLMLFSFAVQASAEMENARGDFVGSEKCMDCHTGVYDEWRPTRHANVMRKLYTDDNNSISAPWGTETEPKEITTSNSDRRYTLYMKGKEYWVTIHDKNDSSRDRNYRVDAVGYTSQTMFFSYLEDKESLLTLPFNYWNDSAREERWGNAFDLFWFTEDGSIDDKKMEVFEKFYGYENRCADCHLTGFNVETWKDYPVIGRSADKTNIWTTTEFAIGCEKCHGPGGKHVETGDKKDIVNPAELKSVSGSEECDQCHQSGHPINYDNGFWTELPVIFDENNPNGQGKHYNVGDKLSDYYVANVRKKWAGTEYFQQAKSYTMQVQSTKHAENGMNCKTCHDPHTQKTRMPANDLCLSCHTDKGTKEHMGKTHMVQEVNCVDCHMPFGSLSFLRSVRYDARLHVFKPIKPAESLAQFDYIKQFTLPDADPMNKLTKSWAKIQANGECYDSYKYPNNVHYCTDFDVMPNACSSCHKSEFPTPGKFDDAQRNKLVKGQERYERLIKAMTK
jgi:predicted CXXCH cytochrome family protein